MLSLYKNIKMHRKRLGMTQDELARKAGYTDRSSIAKIEKGVVDLPQSKIEQFASIFNISASELMGWEEVQKKNDTRSDIVIRLMNDEVFSSIVEDLNKLDTEQLSGIRQMLSAFLK